MRWVNCSSTHYSLNIHRHKSVERCNGMVNIIFRVKVVVLSTKCHDVRISYRSLAVSKPEYQPVMRIADAGEGAEVSVADFSVDLDSLVNVAGVRGGFLAL